MTSSSRLSQLRTLLELLAFRAQDTPDRVAYELESARPTFSQLWEGINRFAAALLRDGLQPGERVLLALPNSPGFFTSFYGVQRAGGIPVPLYPDSGAARMRRIASQCGAQRVVIPAERKDLPETLVPITPDSGAATLQHYPEIHPENTAYIQFTSGSTGDPKGVVLTHDNLLTNIRQMIAGMEITADDVFVSWLPVYHDMGLIILTMIPFFLAARLVLLPTSFVNLRRWLTTIEEVGGTFTASPDFGYRLALRYAGRAGSHDLSSLRVAMNAAELARVDTIETFEQAFGLNKVMTVGYGLAEATVGVSMTPPGAGVHADDDGFVSVSPPFPGVEVAILNAAGHLAEPGELGEILVRSPANTSGYFEDPDATAALFWRAGYLRTGDTGYIDARGELYVIGREKEMLKQSGRTLAPREVEAALEDHPLLRSVAAISADLGGLAGEQVLVFAEVRRPGHLSDEEKHALVVDLVARVKADLGFRPARVYLVRPRTIPQTANGKMQRIRLKENYLAGKLNEMGFILYPDF